MTASKLQTTVVSTYDGWVRAMEQLGEAAKRLGLTLQAWGAYPTEPPKIKIEDGQWTCPHCAVVSEDLGCWMNDSSQQFASAATTEDEAPGVARLRELWGHGDVKGPYWDLSTGIEEPDTISYVCDACGGFVDPADPVVIT